MNIRYRLGQLWLLAGTAYVIFLMMAQPAHAAVEKICPPATDDPSAIETLIGQTWGYADKYGQIVLIGLIVILIIVSAIEKLRKSIFGKVVTIGGMILIAGTLVAFAGNIGTC